MLLNTPIDIADLGLEYMMLVDLKSFWSSVGNVHQVQIASRNYFQNKTFLNEIDIILRKHETDPHDVAAIVTEDPELCF